jgi:hypothetical protein
MRNGESEGSGGGDLSERPRRPASERSERALLGAPTELALSPKSDPSDDPARQSRLDQAES